jgi:hypothetical protein
MQSPIVDKADTSEHLSKDDTLLISGIEPILIGPLRIAHCLFAFVLFLDMRFYYRQDLSIEGAIVLLGYLSYLFQQMSRKPDGESLYIIFHVAIITLNWLHDNRPRFPVAYRSLRVEEGTKKQAEEFPNDEVGLLNTFITRSLQQYEYIVFPSKAKGRAASSDSPGY